MESKFHTLPFDEDQQPRVFNGRDSIGVQIANICNTCQELKLSNYTVSRGSLSDKELNNEAYYTVGRQEEVVIKPNHPEHDYHLFIHITSVHPQNVFECQNCKEVVNKNNLQKHTEAHGK